MSQERCSINGHDKKNKEMPREKACAYLCTLKTGIPIEDVDPILKLLRGVSHPEIQLGISFLLVYCIP